MGLFRYIGDFDRDKHTNTTLERDANLRWRLWPLIASSNNNIYEQRAETKQLKGEEIGTS